MAHALWEVLVIVHSWDTRYLRQFARASYEVLQNPSASACLKIRGRHVTHLVGHLNERLPAALHFVFHQLATVCAMTTARTKQEVGWEEGHWDRADDLDVPFAELACSRG